MERTRSISKSMMSYIKRAREHKEFLLKETKEFERGKRHLANMMGVEPQQMTQSDIDDAITYLFPSGLFDKRARPVMKHPDLLFKAQKDAQFGEDGRPFHHLFYTTLPNYFQTLNTLSRQLRELNKYEDHQLAKGIVDPPEESKFEFSGRQWLGKPDICDKLIEPISDSDYDYLIKSLNHLAKHPYSNRAKSFLGEFSKDLPGQTLNLSLPELKRDEATGQLYTEMVERRREHEVYVKTVLNGTGKIDIEGHDILYFIHPYLRSGLLSPLRMTGMQDRVDIFAKLVRQPRTIGCSAVAGCIRRALSLSIAAYVDPEMREKMRLSGLLTLDLRLKERKKFGQMKARRKYTWKKR